LKRAEFGVHRELGKYLKPVKTKEIGLETVKNSTKPHAFIITRDLIDYEVLRSGQNHFIRLKIQKNPHYVSL